MSVFNLNKVQRPTPGKKIGDPSSIRKSMRGSQPELRRAVSLAIDRAAMIPSVFYGRGGQELGDCDARHKVWHSADLLKLITTPTRRRTLAGLGWKDGNGDGINRRYARNPVTFSLKTNTATHTHRDDELHQGRSREGGINVITSPVASIRHHEPRAISSTTRCCWVSRVACRRPVDHENMCARPGHTLVVPQTGTNPTHRRKRASIS